MSTLLWITVPGGFSESGAAVLRVIIAPRLDAGTLKSNGMDDWPPTSLVAAPLTIDFAGSPDGPVQHVQVMPPHIQPKAGAWGAFFALDTIISPPQLRHDADPRVTVDATSVTAAAIATIFTTAAATPLRLGNDDDRAALDNVVRTQLAAHWSDDQPPPPPPPPPSTPPSFQPPEFHHTIALLREHPAVLRGLGLIIELSIPRGALPLQSGVVKVGWPAARTVAPALPNIVSPWTQFDNLMLPASTPNISAGMVALTDDRPGAGPSPWQVVSVDVEFGGAAPAQRSARERIAPRQCNVRAAGAALGRADAGAGRAAGRLRRAAAGGERQRAPQPGGGAAAHRRRSRARLPDRHQAPGQRVGIAAPARCHLQRCTQRHADHDRRRHPGARGRPREGFYGGR